MTAVIDASALLAMLQGEPGGDRVVSAMPNAAISTVNISEVVAKLCDKGFDADQTRETLEMLPITVVDFDFAQAIKAGSLRPPTRAFGLSFGDRACLALALRDSAGVLTTDRAWADLDLGIDVQVIR
ncbi:MAG TPA: type II toxin-antitoxin system VapC family toxin [Thermohalobaculum sp.]|nr:type II toxin-antitoxin system VapC family toxin [Thermohalobaculum sp.]